MSGALPPAPRFEPVHVGSLYPGEFAVDPNELLKFLQGPTGMQQQPAQAGAHDLMPGMTHAAADGSATETTRFAGILNQAMDFTKNLLTRLSTGRRGSVEAFQGINLYEAAAQAAANGNGAAHLNARRRSSVADTGPVQRRSSVSFGEGGWGVGWGGGTAPAAAGGFFGDWSSSPNAVLGDGGNAGGRYGETPWTDSTNPADFSASGNPQGPNMLELEAAKRGFKSPGKGAKGAARGVVGVRARAVGRSGGSVGGVGGAGEAKGTGMNVNVLDEASREQFKSNVIEVASFLHQVQAESWGINEVPKP